MRAIETNDEQFVFRDCQIALVDFFEESFQEISKRPSRLLLSLLEVERAPFFKFLTDALIYQSNV